MISCFEVRYREEVADMELNAQGFLGARLAGTLALPTMRLAGTLALPDKRPGVVVAVR